MNENEIWKDIDGYEGLYQVSNLGRVKSLNYNHTNQEKILRQIKTKGGYVIINLCKNGKSKNFLVHRLVANAFLENLNNLPQVNHIDENKENNVVSNLEFCDAKYNNNYGTAIQRRVANTDYKAITAKIDYKAFQEKRVANTDWKSIGRKNAEKLTNGVLSKQVYQYNKKGELIKIWESTAECGRNGFHFGNVAACCRGERKTHKGYIWSYEEIKKGE